MPRSIVDDISSSKKAYSSDSSDELTIEKAREKFRTEAARRQNELAKKNIEEQVKLENALREKGLTEGSKAWKKAMKKVQEDLEKEKLIEEMATLASTYSYETNLNKKLAEEKRALNKAILESEMSSFQEKLGALGSELRSNAKEGLWKGAANLVGGLTKGLDSLMESYAQYQGKINARIQGLGKSFTSMEDSLTKAVGVQSLVKNQSLVENLASLVDSGIAYNIELRAFLETVSDNIATTFDATNGTLLRLVRIQQADSTAARLGLEASLTSYFNKMYQNTEYLSNAFDTVASELIEASSTMSNDQAIQFEYQVQKWLGSLYGVGMSDSTVAGIAQALGYLGSGNISALSNSQYFNLIAMALARTGDTSLDSILYGGINAEQTNSILKSLVQYMQELATSTSQVAKSELANTFGITMSDLQASLNLNTEVLNQISEKSMNYASAIGELSDQLKALPDRLNLATRMSNLFSNLQWGQATNIVSNPVLYSIWKVTSLIQDNTGGINIPSIFAVGSGTDLNTTVENLVKLGVVGMSTLGMMGDLVSGIANRIDPSRMLTELKGNESSSTTLIDTYGRYVKTVQEAENDYADSVDRNINGIEDESARLYELNRENYLRRFNQLRSPEMTETGGSGLSSGSSGMTTSSTVIAGQSSGEDIYTSAKQGAYDEATADVQAPEGNNIEELTQNIRDDVHAIYDLLNGIIDVDGIRTYEAI